VSPSAIALSRALKKRGWKFVGPTTVYSFMQSMGLINDHVENCFVRDECELARLGVKLRRKLQSS
jgi:DNA-3-methyladenine glycosylase I